MVTPEAHITYPSTKGAPRSSGPLWVPDGWGETWWRARAQAATRQVVVGIMGDSIGKGTDADPSELHDSWAGRMRTFLQQRYGDGGSGFVSIDLNDITSTGAWTVSPGFGTPSRGGPGGVSWRPTVAGNGATVTFPVKGTTLGVLFKTAPSFGTFNVSVDGGSNQPVALNSAVSVLSYPVTGLAEGWHTVRVTATTGNGEVFGVTGRNATGIVVDNYSGGGASITNTATFGLQTATVSGTGSPTYTTDSLAQMGTPDLFIMMLGVNDVLAAAPTQESISDNLTYLYGRVMAQGATDATPPDIAIVIEHAGKVDTLLDSAVEYSQLAQQLRSYAQAIGAAVVDVWGAGRRSWQHWADLGLWGGSNTDTVHPNAAGHEQYWELIRPLVDW